jgi:hypothetical protein
MNPTHATCQALSLGLFCCMRLGMRKGGVLVLLVCASFISPSFAQDFQNLDFEEANIPDLPPGQTGGSFVTDALPGWTANIGTNQVDVILHNNLTLGTASIDIIGPVWSYGAILAFGGIIQGQYTLVLQSGQNPENSQETEFVNVAVSQTAFVPADAKSIFLKEHGSNFTVSLAGQVIPLSVFGVGSNYTIYAGDVSAFAGQMAELRISTALVTNQPYSMNSFDDISFSPQAIPETSVLLLTIAGALLLWPALKRTRGRG